MKTIIITSGQPFTDIDALACASAYAELLTLQGKKAIAVLPGPLNNSVTEKIKAWQLGYIRNPPAEDAGYIPVDISDPEFFAKFVDINKVLEVYDHRYGFEDYWNKKLGKNSHIEMVGSCATLIWEEFVKNKRKKDISKPAADLLYTAIISNTLNFKASVTTPRDKKAFEELSGFIDLPKNWTEIYFKEQETEIVGNLKGAIINDTKKLKPIIAQLELWNSQIIFKEHLTEIENIMDDFGTDEWIFTSPSISDGINYLLVKNPQIRRLLEDNIGAEFNGDMGTTKKLWLRKEIWKKIS